MSPRTSAVFAQHRRRYLVFHAAAHKHVPLMEANPCEAIKNNVGWHATVVAEDITDDYGAERKFVLVSTDKAVNPSQRNGKEQAGRPS